VTPADLATPPRTKPVVDRLLAALAGLLAAAVALAVGDLVAGLFRDVPSPRDAVGSEFIDRTPRWLKDFAIDQFGTNDKVALRAGMLVVIGLLGLVLGALSLRRRVIGVVGFAAFGIVGAIVAAQRPVSQPLDVLPPLVAAVAGIATLWFLLDRLAPAADARALPPSAAGAAPGVVDNLRAELATTNRKGLDRRGFFVASAAVAAVVVAAGSAGKWLKDRFDVAASRDSVVLPRPVAKVSVTAGTAITTEGISPFFTPNADFYRIDTALAVPQVPADSWRLKVHGLVDRELELTFDDLLRRNVVEAPVTLACVSNEVGGDLVGNATWLGVPIADILEEAGVRTEADQLKSTSTDGWTCGTPVSAVTDGRAALLAFGMNGEPLPVEHGFPVRMVVPGLYGYVSATKWVVDLELTTFADYDAYWVRRGWSAQGPIKTQSRIDTPRPLATVAAGRVAVAGVAWAQHRGIDAVEVRADEGRWTPARLADELSVDTWRQWVWEWDATPGRHKLEVRATDSTGAVQPEERVEPFPDGATGWHSVVVQVT
jgi:DMSO/TMAO reductase YedYZ molybdopterin-dependent catalytic subunit